MLRQADERPIDCFLRLPQSGSRLVLRLPPEIEARIARVFVASDEHEFEPELGPAAAGALAADLSDFDGDVVRLRFESRDARPIDWIQPRIEGRDPIVPPALPPPPEPPSEPPNVLLYVVDALRADRLSVYGYALPTSPRLEELAARSVVFDAAYATGPNTRTSIPALLASMQPEEVQGRLRRTGNAVRHVLPEVFRRGGFGTGGFQANYWLRRPLGFGRGFDVYEVLERSEGTAEALHTRVLEWVREAPRPFFLYVQSLDVHSPYEPPAPFAGRFGAKPLVPSGEAPDTGDFEFREGFRDLYPRLAALEPHLYDDAVAYADHELGGLLDELARLGLAETTIVVVTADHGESLGEGNRWLHGLSLHEEQVRVPLIVALPWASQPQRRDEVVSLVDLGPTLLDAVGLRAPVQFRGRSLLREGNAQKPRAAIGSRGGEGWFVREGDWKLVTTRGVVRLYHLPSDPDERVDRSADLPVRTGYLTSLLRAGSRGFRETVYRPLPLDAGLGGEERRQLEEDLRALGYVE